MAYDTGTVHSITDGGVAGLHPEVPPPPAIVAATHSGHECNTLKRSVVPFACWRAHDVRFKFDSSFVLPEIKSEIKVLKKLMAAHTLPDDTGQPSHRPVLSVFGHADPTGSDDYNKVLSGKRAQAIYALLVRDVGLWDDLYQNPQGNDRWEPDVIQAMQTALGQPLTTHPSASERKALYQAYMDSICTVPDDSGSPVVFQLDKTDFLGGGADAKGKGDYQGCSEFNPVMIFSDEQNQQFSDPDQKEARDAENAQNRRVVIFLFRPGVQVNPNDWPCPRVKEGVGGCKKRFWSDGEKRRSDRFPDKEREYEDTGDTFACRFYDRLSNNSPCERPHKLVLLRIRLIDVYHQPIKKAAYTLDVDDLHFDGITDDDGRFRHMVGTTATTGTLRIKAWTVKLDIVKDLGDASEARGARMRIENIGLAAVDGSAVTASNGDAADGTIDDGLRKAILRFQSLVDIEADGTLNGETINKLKEFYGS